MGESHRLFFSFTVWSAYWESELVHPLGWKFVTENQTMAQGRGNPFKNYLLFSIHASLIGTSSCFYQYWTDMGTHGNLHCLNTAANVFIIKESPGMTTFVCRPSNKQSLIQSWRNCMPHSNIEEIENDIITTFL